MIMVLDVHLVRLKQRYKVHFGCKNGKFVSDLMILAPCLVSGPRGLTQLRGPYPNDIKGWSFLCPPRNLSGRNSPALGPQNFGEVCKYK